MCQSNTSKTKKPIAVTWRIGTFTISPSVQAQLWLAVESTRYNTRDGLWTDQRSVIEREEGDNGVH